MGKKNFTEPDDGRFSQDLETVQELRKNQIHTVRIEGCADGGAGVARIGGRVVFIAGALRGERVRALILKVNKSVAFAKVQELLEPSAHRMTPDCPYFPRCGGCTYRHMDYAEELRLKKQRVQDALTRIGGSDVEVEEIIGADDVLRYRNKSIWPVSPDGAVGFYRARTHEVVDVERCLLVHPAAEAAAAALRNWMARCGVRGYDEATGEGLIRHLFVRNNARGEALLCVVANAEALPHEARHRGGDRAGGCCGREGERRAQRRYERGVLLRRCLGGGGKAGGGGPAAGRRDRRPAAQGPRGGRGARDRGHGAGARGVRFLRSGDTGAGREALRGAGLYSGARLRGRHVPARGPCGDGGIDVTGKRLTTEKVPYFRAFLVLSR